LFFAKILVVKYYIRMCGQYSSALWINIYPQCGSIAVRKRKSTSHWDRVEADFDENFVGRVLILMESAEN
jgi:hypothetical protein